MKDRTKGLLVLIGSAAAAGILVEATRDRSTDGAADPSQSTSAATSASAPLITDAAPQLATRADIDQALTSLEEAVRKPASDARHPWALAHGLIAFGRDFKADDGRSAVDVIASFAIEKEVGKHKLWLFPARQGESLVEPHRHLLVKSLLETAVPLQRRVKVSKGSEVTVARLVDDARRAAQLPATDRDWHHAAWLLSALIESDQLPGKHAPAPTEELTRAALDQLEKDQKVVVDYAGSLDDAFKPGSPLRTAKEKKTGIYGHSCGGMHLVQAVLSSSQRLGEATAKKRVRRQLGVLLFRYQAERATLKRLLAQHPSQGLLLRGQQLKFFGHIVETLTLARELGSYDPKSEGGQKLDAAMKSAAKDVAKVTHELTQGGVYQRLDSIKRQREQTYLDLVGDACHAIRGLRRLRKLYGS